VYSYIRMLMRGAGSRLPVTGSDRPLSATFLSRHLVFDRAALSGKSGGPARVGLLPRRPNTDPKPLRVGSAQLRDRRP
jgi:hypothetical protein